MQISKERHLLIQNIVNTIKKYNEEKDFMHLSFLIWCLSDDYFEDMYILKLIIRKCEKIDNVGVQQSIENVRKILEINES